MIFKKQKKGMILIFTLGLLFCFMIMPLLFVRLESKKVQFERKIGDLQTGVIDMYQKGDKLLFYIDESGRYASNQAIFDLGLNGGHSEPCEEYQGYALWVNGNAECYPEPKKALPVFVDRYFNEYLTAYPTIIPINNYDFFIKQEDKLNVIGIATINLNLESDNESYSSKYSIKPSFKAVIDYNLNDYNVLKQASKDMVNYVKGCNKSLSLCVSEAKNTVSANLVSSNLGFVAVTECGGSVIDNEQTRTYGFCAKSDKEVIAYDSSQTKTDFFPVVIKFAIKFPPTISP